MHRVLNYSLLLLATLLVALRLSWAETTPLLLDLSGSLSRAQFERIESKVAEISAAKQFDLAVLIVSGHPTQTLREYAYIQLTMRGMNYGGPARALLLIDLKNEETHLAVSQDAEPYLSSGVIDWISENVFKKSIRLASAESDILATLSKIDQLLRSSVERTRGIRECSPVWNSVLAALILSLILGLVVSGMLRIILGRHAAAMSSALTAYLVGVSQMFPLALSISASLLTLFFGYCDLRQLCRVMTFSDRPGKARGS